MSSVNPKKMKVAELKKELENRDITVPKNSKKADLIAMLLSAMESESEQEKDFSSSEVLDDSAVSGLEGNLPDDDKLLEEEEEDEGKVELCDTVTEEQAESMEVEQEAASPGTAAAAGDAKCNEETFKTEVLETESGEDVKADDGVKQEVSDASDKDEAAPFTQEQECFEALEKLEGDAEPEPFKKSDSVLNQTADVSDNKEAKETVEVDGESKPAQEETKQETSRKRRHDDRSDRHGKWDDRYTPPEEEPEDEFDDSVVALDVYNCDLNFKVSRDRFGGQPLTMEGFAYLWAGARASYGVKAGKVFFECKIVEEDAVKHLPSDEPHPRVVRVGWSIDNSSLQLGEGPLSYGYGGTGKFSVDCKFSDYGKTFSENDVIGCYVDFTSEEDVKVFFTKNGEYLGVAATEDKCKIKGQALFPHVLCKNTSVELNFGQKEEPYFPNPSELEGFVLVSSAPKEEMVRAAKSPETKKDCEVLMMCGLPGAGKTFYSRQLMENHPERKYNVLGTNAIMEKMRIMGVTRKKNYAGRWELLIQTSTQCLNRLLQIACRKRRNYILDQTNVYASAQRRKMRPFEGFHRKAVVIVPAEEVYKTRFDNRTKNEGKAVPESAILEMKANLSLPEKGNLFDEVVFAELGREEAEKLAEKYREEGRKNGPPAEKRFRGGDNRGRGRGGWHQHRGFHGAPMHGNGVPWGGFARGGFQPGFRGRGGGGFGNRQNGFGRGGGRGDGRGNFNRYDHGGSNRGWQDFGGQSRRGGGFGGYNRQNQGRGFNQSRGEFQNASSGTQFQRQGNAPKNFQQGNRMMQNTPSSSSSPHSAQSYTYGVHHNNPQQYNAQKMAGFATSSYNYGQQNAAARPATQSVQAQQQSYQQAYSQQDYSQQWAQYYQQQAQNQQYQNYYANYQQYYGQQAGQQIPRQ